MTDKPKKPEINVENPMYAGATPDMVARALLRPSNKRRKNPRKAAHADSKAFQSKT